MEVQFSGHTKTARVVEVSGEDVAALSNATREAFFDHVLYGNFTSPYADYDRWVVKVCEKYGVDAAYTPDRAAFIQALMGGTVSHT